MVNCNGNHIKPRCETRVMVWWGVVYAGVGGVGGPGFTLLLRHRILQPYVVIA